LPVVVVVVLDAAGVELSPPVVGTVVVVFVSVWVLLGAGGVSTVTFGGGVAVVV
jgi:hypothetical protein